MPGLKIPVLFGYGQNDKQMQAHKERERESTLGLTDPSQAIGLAVMDSNPAPMPKLHIVINKNTMRHFIKRDNESETQVSYQCHKTRIL